MTDKVRYVCVRCRRVTIVQLGTKRGGIPVRLYCNRTCRLSRSKRGRRVNARRLSIEARAASLIPARLR